MSKIIFISGACGCGKSTFADAYVKYFVRKNHKTCYLIHGDDFHRGFVEPEDKSDFFVNGQASDQILWEDILRFNWDCMIATAERALEQNLDVVIDYVIEDELPRVQELAARQHAVLYYIVLTADAEEIERRLRSRGDIDLIDRALFLKKKLDAMPENKGHLYNNTNKTTDEAIAEIVLDRFAIGCSNDSISETKQVKKTIPIKTIVDAIEETMDGWQQFYNTITGEVESVPDYDNDYTDMSEFEDAAAKIEDSDDYVRLPLQYELHEYNIMERFAEEKGNTVLMRALHGRRPYRTFKDRATDLGLDQEYYAFRTKAYGEIAREWCRENGIPFAEG